MAELPVWEYMLLQARPGRATFDSGPLFHPPLRTTSCRIFLLARDGREVEVSVAPAADVTPRRREGVSVQDDPVGLCEGPASSRMTQTYPDEAQTGPACDDGLFWYMLVSECLEERKSAQAWGGRFK